MKKTLFGFPKAWFIENTVISWSQETVITFWIFLKKFDLIDLNLGLRLQSQKRGQAKVKNQGNRQIKGLLLIRMTFLYCFHKEVKGQHHWSWCSFINCVLIHSLDPLKDTKPEDWDLNLCYFTTLPNIAPQRLKLICAFGCSSTAPQVKHLRVYHPENCDTLYKVHVKYMHTNRNVL